MKIYKVVADKRPECCLLCPIKSSAVKIDSLDCGKVEKRDIGDGWTSQTRIPDHRCIFEVKN